MDRTGDRLRGVMAENFVAQALAANGLNMYHWNPDQNTEVDFPIQDAEWEVVPFEENRMTVRIPRV